MENKPHFLGKTQENVVPFDEAIGLLTPNEVKKLEKYGKIVEVEQSARELEKVQEVLIETMPEDIPFIQPESGSMPVQGSESVLNDLDNISLSKRSATNSFKINMNLNEDSSYIHEDSGYTQATTDD